MQFHMPSMHYQWIGYRGEDDQRKPRTPLFMMRRPSQPSPSLLGLRSLSTKISCEAEVFIRDSHRQGIKSNRRPDYRIEGSFKRRDCKITRADGQTIASISRKLARTTNGAHHSSSVLLSDDVFSLVVEPGIEPALVMAFIMVIDRLCPKPHTPFLCSWVWTNTTPFKCSSLFLLYVQHKFYLRQLIVGLRNQKFGKVWFWFFPRKCLLILATNYYEWVNINQKKIMSE